MKHGNWAMLFRAELLLFGIVFSGIALFTDQLGIDSIDSWKIKTAMLVIGGLLIILGIILGLPPVTNYIKTSNRETQYLYLNQAFTWCLVSLLIVELILRVTIHNPGLRVSRTNWFGKVFAENTAAFSGSEGYALTHFNKWEEIQTPFDGEGEDIIVMGDSLTAGTQVSDGNKYSSIAEATLFKDGYTLNLHNLGRSGTAMADYVSWVPAYKSLYSVKMIVVQLTEDDFIESFSSRKVNYFISQNNRKIDLIHNFDLSSDYLASPDRFYIIPELLSFGMIRLKQGGQWAGDIPSQNTSLDEFNPDLTGQQLQMLIDVSDGIPLIVVLLPSAPYLSGDQIQFVDKGYEQLKEFITRYPEITIVDPLPEFQKLVSAGCLPRGFFNSSPGEGHLNKYGHEIVGTLLAKAIEQVLK